MTNTIMLLFIASSVFVLTGGAGAMVRWYGDYKLKRNWRRLDKKLREAEDGWSKR